ncbi:hypothetical protein [Rheinheimera sp.]|uniref:hypothetical protein n=1 Tax=Rheinheimera sp. TaxID=1869214 RepID=UPI00307FADCA
MRKAYHPATCDICGELALDSLKPDYALPDVVELCDRHVFQVHDFEAKIIKINQDRAAKRQPTVRKQELIQAFVVCMQHGLIIQVSEPVKKQSLTAWLFSAFRGRRQ